MVWCGVVCVGRSLKKVSPSAEDGYNFLVDLCFFVYFLRFVCAVPVSILRLILPVPLSKVCWYHSKETKIK